MKTRILHKFILIACGLVLLLNHMTGYAQIDQNLEKYRDLITENIYKNYKGMFRESGGVLKYPFITPGSAQYSNVLWDWDSWLSNVALEQILVEKGSEKNREEVLKYGQGCVLNFLSFCGNDGWIPIKVAKDEKPSEIRPDNILATNMHKPCLAQHAAFLSKIENSVEWVESNFFKLEYFVGNYNNHQRDRATGLYFWHDDVAIGVDNDPSTFYRPNRSSGSIYLNCMMYKELEAMVYLSKELGLLEVASQYQKDADDLKAAIRTHCWDERDGFFYSVDLNLKPIHNDKWQRHSGSPRDWDCLIQRIDGWSGFMALWAGIATEEQAERMVNYLGNEKTFNSNYGVRTLSKMEKMYNVKASGNPSSWLGPIWGISNYMVWRGLVDYGFENEAKELATKTIVLFGKDIEKTGVLHEYYEPESGTPILNPGFQNWNYLVMNMLAWMEGKEVIEEF